ncbi:MAG: hypothetical protein FWD53_12590, partial [Phycisphaerales bacterium]|nr:hypothetical protein [Phycisphaerales bacterium]
MLTTLAGCPVDILTPADLPRSAITEGGGGAWDMIYSTRDKAVLHRLEEILKEVVIDQQGLERAINYLQDASGITFYVNWAALQGVEINRQTPVSINLRDVPVRKVLCELLSKAYLGYTVDDGAITISTVEDLASEKYQMIRAYDVRSLLPVGRKSDLRHIRELIMIIETTVAHDTWKSAGGTLGTITEYGNRLIINQTRDNHVAIANVLQQCAERRKSPPPGKASWNLVDSPENRSTKARLNRVAPFVVYNKPFEATLDTLSESARLKFFVNWPALESVGINR